MRRVAFAVLALAGGALGWAALHRLLARPPDDEEQIRALFASAARAVEARRVSDAVEGVSERFQGDGLSKREVKQLIAAQAFRGEWVSVTISGARVQVDGDAADAVVHVVLARGGRGRSLADLLPADASASRLTCRLEREDGAWRVVSASRQPIALAEALAPP